MNDIRMDANIYISLAGLERFDNQRFKNEELNEWIDDNVVALCRSYRNYALRLRPYLAGIYLTPEQATIFKLKFAL